MNLHTIAEITGAIKAGGACMSCHHVPGGLQDLLDEAWGAGKTAAEAAGAAPHSRRRRRPAAAEESEPPVSTYQFDKKIEKAIDQYVRPMLRKDGGDVEIVDIKGTLVYCRLAGACQGCDHAGQTLRLLVERTLEGDGRRADSRSSTFSPLSRRERVRVRAWRGCPRSTGRLRGVDLFHLPTFPLWDRMEMSPGEHRP